jgi:hypothetical protein
MDNKIIGYMDTKGNATGYISTKDSIIGYVSAEGYDTLSKHTTSRKDGLPVIHTQKIASLQSSKS